MLASMNVRVLLLASIALLCVVSGVQGGVEIGETEPAGLSTLQEDILVRYTLNDLKTRAAKPQQLYGYGAVCHLCQVVFEPVVNKAQAHGNFTAEVVQACEKHFPSFLKHICETVIPPVLKVTVDVGSAAQLCGNIEMCTTCCGPKHTPEGVHLALGKDPSAMTVVWTTKEPTPTSIVQYGHVSGQYSQVQAGSSTGKTYLPLLWKGTLHQGGMLELMPSTKYFYRVGCPELKEWSEEHSFTTAPALTDTPDFTMLCVGDMGGEETSDDSVTLMKAEVARGVYDITFHVGDIGYANGAQYLWDHFLRKVEPIASSMAYMTLPGNHEDEGLLGMTAYVNRFIMPSEASGSDDRRYYSFDYSHAHFVALSTEWNRTPVKPGSVQYKWLEEDLKKANENRAERPWLVVGVHRPLYCTTNESDNCGTLAVMFREYFEDLFIKYKVDLVIQAHEHNYERMYPVYNNTLVTESYDSPTVPVYLINGAGGCKEHIDGFRDPAPAWSAYRASDYGYSRVRFTHSAIKWEFIRDYDNAVVDSWSITKS